VLTRLPDEVLPPAGASVEHHEEEPMPEDPWDVALEQEPLTPTLDRAMLLRKQA